MRKIVIGTSLAVLTAWEVTLGAPPPLDRPTPPPCCADGQCHPSHLWGYYGTRWRLWPGVSPDTAPRDPTALDRLGPDLAPIETPPPEQEDRQAPPRSEPRREPSSDEEREGIDARPMTPRTAPSTTPQTAPFAPSMDPALDRPEEQQPFDLFNDGPLDSSPLQTPPVMPWDEVPPAPTGDADPPPALPFRVLQAAGEMPAQAAPATSRGPAARPPSAKATQPDDDPPPSLPLALVGRQG